METTILSCPEKRSAYPGEYIDTGITAEELLFELQQEHAGEANPLINIEENADAFIIQMAAPGLKNSDFNVSINGKILTVACLHKDDECEKKVYLQQEFNFRCFTKDIVVLENIDTYFISTEYVDGILCVNLPKTKTPFIHRSERIVVY